MVNSARAKGRRTARWIALFGLLVLPMPGGLSAGAAGQAAPANDNFVNRIALNGTSINTSGTNVAATKETGEPDHGGNSGGSSVWWTWTAPSSGTAAVDTIGSGFDTLLGVYTGSSVSALTTIASDDDGGIGLQSRVMFDASQGTAYQIAVDGYAADTGSIALNLILNPALYDFDFDSGAAGWVFTQPVNGVGWAVDSTPASFPSGVSRSGSSLNYNDGTDYAGCGDGGALSPSLNVGGTTNPVLTFWCNYNTETRSTQYDRRTLQIWNDSLTTKLADWQLASVGYTFDPAGGLVGGGPGPCAEAYIDLELGVPVTAWHKHRVVLDPAWGTIRLWFTFWTTDDLRNNYAGWTLDDLWILDQATPFPTGWPDMVPDTTTLDGDGNELDICQRDTGDLLKWSWGASNLGATGVHMIIGYHDQATLDASYMYFDTSHGHYHMSQYSDFTLWKQQAFGLQKLRRGPKRSYCLIDVDQVITGTPSISPGCDGSYQAISYGWQDVYALGTPGQEIDVSGLATGTDYYLVGVIDPLNRLRETDDMNQTDQIHFTLSSSLGQVAILDRNNPFPPSATALTITSTTLGTFQGNPAVRVIGTGFDTTLVPVLYDAGTNVEEAPFYTIVSTTEIWVDTPSGFGTPTAIDLLRARGDAASYRMGNPTPTSCPPPGPPGAGPLTLTPSGGLSPTGNVGGPFSPSSITYTISNPGIAGMDWTATNLTTWVNLSSSSGTLSPGAGTTVTVSIDASAGGLPAGTYFDTVTFTNTTNGSGNTTRPVDLTATGGVTGPLAVSNPPSGFAATGNAGGPFTPPSQTYTLTNSGSWSIDWEVRTTQGWISLSASSGTLAPGASTTVTVSINSGANLLGPGSYSDAIVFANLTSGSGSTTRPVTLTVQGVAEMSVTPTDALASWGPVGGPFNPASAAYTIANSGAGSIDWTAAGTQAWISLSPSSGTVTPGASVTVAVSINAGANVLAAGSYPDTIAFTNTTTGSGTTTVSVLLTVSAVPPPTVTLAPPPPSSSTSPLVITGTASGGTVASVVWSNAATGESGTATGTTAWSAAIPLTPGTNEITITVFDNAGGSSRLVFQVDGLASGGGGGGSGGGCGTVGLDALALLGLIGLLFRRRTR